MLQISKTAHIFINAIIIINATVLGILTIPNLTKNQVYVLETIDNICLIIFCIEITIRLFIERTKFFKNNWNCFDFIVVVVSVLSFTSAFSIGRAFRVIKLLKSISSFHSLRIVTITVFKSLTEMGGIIAFLFVIFYVFTILGNQLFGKAFPEFFGSFGNSMFTLFQIMTLDAWSDQIARPILEKFPFAWGYFVTFIFLTTIVILNVVVGMIVETVSHINRYRRIKKFKSELSEDEDLLHEIAELQIHLDKMNKILTHKHSDL